MDYTRVIDAHLQNAIAYHHRNYRAAVVEAERREQRAKAYVPDLSMIEHRLRCIEGRIAAVERKQTIKRRKK